MSALITSADHAGTRAAQADPCFSRFPESSSPPCMFCFTCSPALRAKPAKAGHGRKHGTGIPDVPCVLLIADGSRGCACGRPFAADQSPQGAGRRGSAPPANARLVGAILLLSVRSSTC